MRWLITGARTVVTWSVMVVVTALSSISATVIAWRDPTSPAIDWIVRFWSGLALRLAGIKLVVEGAERLEPDQSYVLAANHISIIDIFVHARGMPVPIRFLAKKELFRIPLLGRAMRDIGVVPVDRDGGRGELLQMNRDARETMRMGKSLIVYPEGTRSRDGALQSFKKGAFVIAVMTSQPIVPTTIHGTREAMKADSIWIRGGVVTLVIDDPIATEGMGNSDIDPLMEQTREIIAKRYEGLGGMPLNEAAKDSPAR